MSASHVHQEEEAIRDGLGILHLLPTSPATVAASGTYNVTLVSHPLQVDGTAPTDTILSALQEELLFRTLNLGGLKAMLSPARSIAILDSGKCVLSVHGLYCTLHGPCQ